MVLIPFGNRLLALDDDVFQAALKTGKTYLPTTTTAPPSPTEILDSDGMHQRTGVPASWFEQAARESRIPNLHFGKYVRFDVQAVLAVLTDDRLIGQPAVVRRGRKLKGL